jgi:hypothetical protein
MDVEPVDKAGDDADIGVVVVVFVLDTDLGCSFMDGSFASDPRELRKCVIVGVVISLYSS